MANKNKKYQVFYEVEADTLKDAIKLAIELEGETGLQPKGIMLPNDKVLPYDDNLARQYVFDGSITEKEYLEQSNTAD